MRKYNLDKDFKMNIEANHATLAGHTFQHELRIARDNGVFGSIDANQGDMLLGWDTDQFPTDLYNATMCMYEVLKQGGFTNGGLNFDAKARRASNTVEDIFISYIAGMDAFAYGLIVADLMIKDGVLDKFVDDRYASYKAGIGKKFQITPHRLKNLKNTPLKAVNLLFKAVSRNILKRLLINILFWRVKKYELFYRCRCWHIGNQICFI